MHDYAKGSLNVNKLSLSIIQRVGMVPMAVSGIFKVRNQCCLSAALFGPADGTGGDPVFSPYGLPLTPPNFHKHSEC